jgi:hypothetical protein
MNQNECLSSQKSSFNIIWDHAATVTWDTTLHGATNFCLIQLYFLFIGKGLYIGVKVYNIFLYCDFKLSLANFYTTTVYSCALAKGDLGCANVTRTNPAFVHKVTVTQNGKWA